MMTFFFFYLDVAVSLIQDHLDKLWVLQCVQEVGIQAVEIWLNADALHDQVLRNPGHKLIFHSLLEFLNLRQRE